MHLREIVEKLFEFWMVRAIIGGLVFFRGCLFLLFGQVYKASVDYCWVYRVSDVRFLKLAVFPIIKWMIKAGDQTGRNLILSSFLKSKEAIRARERYTLSGKGNLDLMRDVIVLKEKAEDEKGVILIKYTPTFDAFLSFLDVERMLKDYYIVLEISWSGACDPSILLFISARNHVIIQVPEKEDFDFITKLNSNVLPIILGSGDWVDPDTFVLDSSVEKEYDVIMVANWGSFKKHKELFNALSKIMLRPIKVLLVGFAWGGRTKDDILKEMNDYDLSHVSVEFRENIPPDEVRKCLNASKIFVLLSKKEGGNKAMVEGFFCNVPAILYENNKGGNREKINSQTGVLSSYEDLPEKILYLLKDHKKFSPRDWAVENTGSRIATARLNGFIMALAERNKEKWTADIVEKINIPNLSYKLGEHKDKMSSVNWESYFRQYHAPSKRDSNRHMHPITALKSAIGAIARPFILSPWVIKDRFPIFMFHRVIEDGTDYGMDEHLTITKGAFDETIVFLETHFQIVDIMEAVEKTRSNGRPVCAVTFDDGWRDSYDVAFPILKKHAVPATIFLCAGLVGTHHEFWFERTGRLVKEVVKSEDGLAKIKSYCGPLIPNEALKDLHDNKTLVWQINQRLKGLRPGRIHDWLEKAEAHFSIVPDVKRNLLDWEEIREMSHNDISFGSHGMSHNILTFLDKEEKFYELAQSKKILSERGINFVPAISFPNGNYDQETINMAEEVGYKVLLTASINKCGDGESKHLYHRINISTSTSRNLNIIFYNIARALTKRKL